MTDNTNPLPGLLQMVVGGVARHLLTGVAGSLAGAGYLSHDQQTQMIAGGAALIVWVAGVGWSILQKKATASTTAQLVAANQNPVPNAAQQALDAA